MAREDAVRRGDSRSRARDAAGGVWRLAGLVGSLAVLAWLLWLAGGPPRSPAGILDIDRLVTLLTSSRIAEADVAAVATTVGWLALGYLAGSIVLRLLVASIARLASGAAWTRGALRATDLVTLPVVRRVVDGALAGVLLAASWLPPMMAGRANAIAEPAAAVALDRPLERSIPAAPPDRPLPRQDVEAGYFEYTVGHGDYLWSIARRLYGDGSRWPEIFEANRGRVMTDGAMLTDPNNIEPGWRLRIPLPASHVEARDGVATRYQVRPSDSLWAIAERLLADGFRWTELWELNRGREMAGGRHFVDADLIYPGWWLELPAIAVESPQATATPQLDPSPTVPATPADASEPPGPVDNPGSSMPPTEPRSRFAQEWDWRSFVRPIVFTAAGFAVVGSAVILVRRLPGMPRPPWPLARGGRRGGLGDAGRVTVAARAVRVALADLGFPDVRPLFAVEQGERLEFALRCAPGDADALVGARHELGRRLACRVDAELVGSTRVTVRLERFRRLAALLLEDAPDPPPLLVPAGANDDGIVYLDLATAGVTTVAGDASRRRTMLGAWLATLRAAHGPDSIAVRCDVPTAGMLGAAERVDGGVVPAPKAALLGELEEVILSRDEAGAAARPIVALVSSDGALDGRLESIGRRGPGVGVFVVTDDSGDAVHRVRGGGAVVRLAGAVDSVEDDEARAPEVLLELPGGERLELEPVRVRVDDSAYWREASSEVRPQEDEEAPDHPETDGDPEPGLASDPEAEPLEDLWDDEGEDEAVREEAGLADDAALSDSPLVLGPSAGETPALAGVKMPPVAPPARGTAPLATSPRTETAPLAVRQTALLLDEPEQADAASVTQVLIRCLGSFEVECAGTLIEHWRVQKSRELLAFLVSRGGSVAREVVMEALWPEEEPKRCSQLLHTAAHYLRRALREASGEEAAFVVSASGRYRLEPGWFQVDLDLFEGHLRRAQAAPDTEGLDEIEQAVLLYRGEFLQDEPYEWADAFRADFAARFAAAARLGGSGALSASDVDRARQIFERVLACDPTDEEAARGLMRVYLESGDQSGARKVYRALEEALRRAFEDESIEPAEETTALLQGGRDAAV